MKVGDKRNRVQGNRQQEYREQGWEKSNIVTSQLVKEEVEDYTERGYRMGWYNRMQSAGQG